MKIRRIKKSDLNSCTEILIKEFSKEPYFEKWTKENAYLRLIEILEISPAFCFCVTEENKIIGFVFCRIFTYQDGKHAFVEEIALDDKYQDRGVGRELLLKLEEVLKKNKIVQIDLLSNEKAKAYRFFHKGNFRTCDWKYLIKHL